MQEEKSNDMKIPWPDVAAIAVIVAVVIAFGLCVHTLIQDSSRSFDQVADTTILSAIDQRPMTPGSVHCAHVKSLTQMGAATLDSGKVVVLFFTGWSSPEMDFGRGRLCASVPSFEDHDEDGTYFFRSFVPDAAPAKAAPGIAPQLVLP